MRVDTDLVEPDPYHLVADLPALAELQKTQGDPTLMNILVCVSCSALSGCLPELAELVEVYGRRLARTLGAGPEGPPCPGCAGTGFDEFGESCWECRR